MRPGPYEGGNCWTHRPAPSIARTGWISPFRCLRHRPEGGAEFGRGPSGPRSAGKSGAQGAVSFRFLFFGRAKKRNVEKELQKIQKKLFKIKTISCRKVADAPKPLWRRYAAGNPLSGTAQTGKTPCASRFSRGRNRGLGSASHRNHSQASHFSGSRTTASPASCSAVTKRVT